MDLKITWPARKIMELKNIGPIRKKMVVLFIGILEKIFGTKLLLEIPGGLQDDKIEILDAIEKAAKLKEAGILSDIKKDSKFPDEPLIHIYSSRYSQNKFSYGSDFFDRQKAMWRSIGESVERHLWAHSDSHWRNKIKYASWEEIKHNALDIFRLAGWSEKQKIENPIIRFDKKTRFGWIPAISLTEQKKLLCPIQLVSLLYSSGNARTFQNTEKKEPMLRWCVSTGLATSHNLEGAILGGILEVIERDAYMITYLNKISPPVIDLEYLSFQDEELEKIHNNFKRYNLEVYCLHLLTDFSVNTIASVIIDRTGLGPAFTIGNSSKFDLKEAILSSLSEALVIRLSLKKRFNQPILKEKKDMNASDRILYWSKIENLEKISYLTQGPRIKIELERNFFDADIERNKNKQSLQLEKMIQEIKDKHMEAFYVELSDSNIQKIGFRSVQVIIPELQPLYLSENLPYFGGKRLKSVPLKLGYQPAEELNKDPHPFS